jgi:HEAT repeat protein
VTDLFKLLEEGDTRKALAAVIEDEDLWTDLIEFLEANDEDIRRSAFEVVATAGNHPSLLEALPMLIKGLESDDEVICRNAAESLYNLGPDASDAVESLVRLISHEDSELRRASARLINAIGPAVSEILEHLIIALSDSDEVVRGEVAYAMMNVDKDLDEAVPHLVELLMDEEEFEHKGKIKEVRMAAQEALIHIGLDAVPGLLEALRNDRADYRLIVITTLAQIKPIPEEAIKEIEDAAQDPDETIQTEARKALKKIKANP